MSQISTDIEAAAIQLKKGEVIAIPTETVYGLAGNIFCDKALKKIYELKKRPLYNPLIVHIKSIDALANIAIDIPEKALKLAEKFWPGPLTLVLKKQVYISDIVTAGKQTVAVRVPNHPAVLSLLEKIDFPLAAPSANPFGSISPTSAQHVADYFKAIPLFVLDGGNCIKGVESTIVGFLNDDAILYRHGSISVDEIEAAIGTIKVFTKSDDAPEAPGMLPKHYAPKTKTILTDHIQEQIKFYSDKKIGLLLFQNEIDNIHIKHQEVLSPFGDLSEAATNLYAALHRLDKQKLDIIIAEKFPDFGLGKTINDRLERAAK
jgi:L-threonylcarbamoyladenylate synthase